MTITPTTATFAGGNDFCCCRLMRVCKTRAMIARRPYGGEAHPKTTRACTVAWLGLFPADFYRMMPPALSSSSNSPADPTPPANDAPRPVFPQPVNRPFTRTVAQPVAHATARGFAFNLSAALLTKVFNFGGQIVLSWLLGAREFGYVGLAMTVASFAVLVQQGGVKDLLIQRGRSYAKWANSVFWMSIAFGVGSMVLMLIAAPLAAAFFHDRRLLPLIALFSLINIPQALCVVPDAKLLIDLRYKLSAALTLLQVVVMMVLSILFAAMHMGAYSILLPVPIVNTMRLLIVWPLTRPPVRADLQLRRWRYLLGSNFTLVAAMFLLTVTYQGDYVMLGWLWPDKEIVGRYFWAFNLSAQTMQLIAMNLGSVLLPSLATLQAEPRRLLTAFLRASKAMALVVIPACLLQVALADPLIRAVFKPRWFEAIVLVQILSAGWVFLAISPSATSLLKARGQFATYLRFYGFYASLFLAMVYIGARQGAAVGTATAVSLCAVIAGPASVYVASRRIGGRWRDVAEIFLPPLGAAAVAVGCAWGLGQLLPGENRLHLWLRVVTVTAVSGVLYIPLIRIVAPEAFADLLERAIGLLRRGRAAPAEGPVAAGPA